MPDKILALLLASALALPSLAADRPSKSPAEAKAAPSASISSTAFAPSSAGERASEDVSETRHSATIGGKEIDYTARAGTLTMKDESGKPRANLFYIAYTLNGVSDLSRRPIAFVFNGGPGASSVWLHLGALGPRRIALNDDGSMPPPPFRRADNEYSLLDVADLVFIDPVGTGYSRAAEGVNPDQFHGVDEDRNSVGDFIRLYATRNRRWSSPKFLIGESYGTTRATLLSNYLQDRFGMYLNGVVLISSVLNFATLSFDGSSDLPYVLYLPSYAAVAWHHKRLPGDLQKSSLAQVVREAKEFAGGRYVQALMQGSKISDKERAETARQLARFTGLPSGFINRADLRIDPGRFEGMLLRDERKDIGRYDGRYVMEKADPAGERAGADASYEAVKGVFAGNVNDYLRTELGYKSDLNYEFLTGFRWNYESGYPGRPLNVSDDLKGAIASNPYLKVFVANGYFDLATPFYATEYTFDHMGLAPSQRENVSMGYYKSGHMIYLDQPSLAALKGDLSRFIRSALSSASPEPAASAAKP
jgi:carboxypeptidase C (cathepsin A)